MENISLWGEFGVIDTQSPKSILQTQADFLEEQTKGLLKGEIKEKTFQEVSAAIVSKYSPISKKNNIIKCTFWVNVPNMNHYSLALFDVVYSIFDFYPLTIIDKINDVEKECNTQDDFLGNLRLILQSQAVSQLIKNLIVLSR